MPLSPPTPVPLYPSRRQIYDQCLGVVGMTDRQFRTEIVFREIDPILRDDPGDVPATMRVLDLMDEYISARDTTGCRTVGAVYVNLLAAGCRLTSSARVRGRLISMSAGFMSLCRADADTVESVGRFADSMSLCEETCSQ